MGLILILGSTMMVIKTTAIDILLHRPPIQHLQCDHLRQFVFGMTSQSPITTLVMLRWRLLPILMIIFREAKKHHLRNHYCCHAAPTVETSSNLTVDLPP